MKVPKWAEYIFREVCDTYNLYPTPQLVWRRRRSKKIKPMFPDEIPTTRPKPKYSGGVAYVKDNKIVITAGKDRKDQKLVLLHELAHMISPPEEYHGRIFWETAWKLYRQYKVPLRYAYKREGEYRTLSKVIYRQLRNSRNE